MLQLLASSSICISQQLMKTAEETKIIIPDCVILHTLFVTEVSVAGFIISILKAANLSFKSSPVCYVCVSPVSHNVSSESANVSNDSSLCLTFVYAVSHLYRCCLTSVCSVHRGCRSRCRRTTVPRHTAHRNRPGQLISSRGAGAAQPNGRRASSGKLSLLSPPLKRI